MSRLTKLFAISLISLSCAWYCTAQKRQIVIDQKIVLQPASSKKIQFGLQAGDTLILNFEELNGKKLGAVDIQGKNGGTVLFEYDVKEIEEKKAKILKTGIYELGLKNKALDDRTFKIKIERLPKEANDRFDSKVYVAYKSDTSYYTVKEDYLVSIDTTIISVVPHQIEKIEPVTGKNKGIFQVDLPSNIKSWAYYIGVGDSSEEIFNKAEAETKKYRNLVADSNGSALMAGLTLTEQMNLSSPDGAENVQYWFVTDEQDVAAFMEGQVFYLFEKGNSSVAFGRKVAPNSGTFFMCFLNDNDLESIDVHIRIAAVTINEVWGIRDVQKYSVNTYEELYLKN